MARYTDEFRSLAVLTLKAQGYPDRPGALHEVAKKIGVPDRTLSRWFRGESNPPPDKLVSIKKDQIIEMLLGEIYSAIKDMPTARPDADYKELATAMAIMVDKVQLLEGEPTERTEHINGLSHEERIKRVDELLNRARTRRTGHAPGSNGQSDLVH